MKKIVFAAIGFALLTGTVLAASGREGLFKKIDADADGNVTLTEHTDFWQQFFKRSDKNEDGVLEWKEFAVSAFDRADKNKDKKVDPAEHDAFRARHFKILDTNKDGQLTLEEYKK